jgi:glycine cleavage system transcriptional repressor
MFCTQSTSTALCCLVLGANFMPKAIISILGQDRPGIVAAVSKVLYEQNCNIENVSQTTLQSEFAGIFIVSMPQGIFAEALHRSLAAQMIPLGLDVHLRLLEPRTDAVTPPQSEAYIITTKGPDRKGLVAGISEVIARFEGNITNLQAVFKGGDDPGDNIMIYEVDLPPQTDQQVLYQELKKRANELSLEIDMQHRQIFEAINRI